ncbi:MAG: ABC transporter permease [Theionarchaea archaeon]|nr:ABC transporter permease [Theionarchaea archaeon]MBU7000155.1 ABC transporter permease [Theionarchaea archaeon]MBU7020872.1 ABC transporter permease [Theionarchaea archaeon]MBU7034960.1 ABC transporter permease [Theionarchaea archaeon]MBU7039186.1 ABC transporter permease [Theionarchaea archaeon]
MNVYRVMRFETSKLFRQKAAHAGLIVVFLVCCMYSVINWMTRPVGSYSGIMIITDNISLQNSLLILPFLAVLIAATSICVEQSSGTLRTLFTRPVKRDNVITGKFLAIFLYMCLIVYGIALISFLFAIRWGFPEDFISFIPRLLLICLVYILINMVVVAFTFVVASQTTSIALTALASIGFYVISMLVEFFSQVQTYTFLNNAQTLLQMLLGGPFELRSAYFSVGIIFIYIVGLLLIASLLWEKRDIMS